MTTASNDSLPFEAIRVLLDSLDVLLHEFRSPGSTRGNKDFYRRRKDRILKWVQDYHSLIIKDCDSILATLSLLLPGLRRDWVYYVQEHDLSSNLARIVGVGHVVVKRLSRWRSTHGDLGAAFESIVQNRVLPSIFSN
jgi:hypothetical protein